METIIATAVIIAGAAFYFCSGGYPRPTDDPEIIKVIGVNEQMYS